MTLACIAQVNVLRSVSGIEIQDISIQHVVNADELHQTAARVWYPLQAQVFDNMRIDPQAKTALAHPRWIQRVVEPGRAMKPDEVRVPQSYQSPTDNTMVTAIEKGR